MTRILIVLASVLALSVPAALAAPPAGKGKPESPGKSAAAPGQSDEKNAAKKCKAERKRLGATAFAELYGTNANKANAFGKCVATQEKAAAAAAEATEEARENAAKKCKKERSELGLEKFRELYAPLNHPNGANAFGKCVAKHAKQSTS